MKKALKFIIALLLVAAPLYGTEPVLKRTQEMEFREVLQKSFMVQGGYYEFFTLRVEPLSAQSQQYVHGMPFDLEKEELKPGTQSPGRLIAQWQLLSNNPDFILTIDAEPLKHVDAATHQGDPAYNTPITYTLLFTYTLSYFDKGQNRAISKDFTISSGVPQKDPKTNNPLYMQNIDAQSYIGSTDGKIYFKLSQDSYNTIHTPKGTPAKLAKGYYHGKVTIKMSLGDEQ